MITKPFSCFRGRALLLPSFNEGFGLPPFEAAIQNVPSICSDRPAMNQVLREAALFADPTNKTNGFLR